MPRLPFLLFAFNFLLFAFAHAQDRPTVSKDATGTITTTFPTVKGRLYNLEAAPDGVNFAPVLGAWLYGSGSPAHFQLAPSPDFSLYPDPADPLQQNPNPAYQGQKAFLRLFLGETDPVSGLTPVTFARYFLGDPGNPTLYDGPHAYLYDIFESDKIPPGAPAGLHPAGPWLAGTVSLPLPATSLLSSRLNGGTIPLRLTHGNPWDLQIQVHPHSALTNLEMELATNQVVDRQTDAHLETADLVQNTTLLQTLLGNVTNTTPGTPPETTPPAPGSLEGAKLRIRSHPAYFLSSLLSDEWFFAHDYDWSVAALLSGDSDHDGLTLEQELALGLSDQNPDWDQDGFPDAVDPQPAVHNFEISPLSNTDPQDGPYLSEFLAEATTTGTPDWVEIHNPANLPADLSGWQLLNHDESWTFPSGVTLAAGAYLIVHCDDGNSLAPETPLHASFKLKIEGEYLALRRPDGRLAHQFFAAYPQVAAGQTYGVSSDRLTAGWLTQATPGTTNSTVATVYSRRLPQQATGTPYLSVTSPATGSTIAASSINILGLARDPYSLRSVKVVANGDTAHPVSAFLRSGRFEARSVPLVNGTNSFTVTATNLWGRETVQTLNLIAQVPAYAPVTLTATPNAGEAPLTSTISSQINVPGNVLSITYDWEGTGEGMTVLPLSQNGLHQATHTFTESGLYCPIVTVRTSLGSFTGTLTEANAIKVYRPGTTLTGPSTPLAAWSLLQKRLKAQDYTGALSGIYENNRESYQELFVELGPNKTIELVNQFGNLIPDSLDEECAQYMGEIQTDQGIVTFFVDFVEINESWQIFSF